ncbi:hypothetical protein KFU94_33335 [Chloroflexi bacterium TSY]|nr:hypothetical protein [Chloroflexi bacterium TSY]
MTRFKRISILLFPVILGAGLISCVNLPTDFNQIAADDCQMERASDKQATTLTITETANYETEWVNLGTIYELEIISGPVSPPPTIYLRTTYMDPDSYLTLTSTGSFTVGTKFILAQIPVADINGSDGFTVLSKAGPASFQFSPFSPKATDLSAQVKTKTGWVYYKKGKCSWISNKDSSKDPKIAGALQSCQPCHGGNDVELTHFHNPANRSGPKDTGDLNDIRKDEVFMGWFKIRFTLLIYRQKSI